MKERSNFQLPYNFTRNEDLVYSFVTDGGIKYIALFIPSGCYDENLENTYNFNFEPEDPKNKNIHDPRIKETIISLIEQFFISNINSVICVCDSIDGRELCRRRLFDKWRKEYSHRLKHIHKEDIEKEGNYYTLCASLLIHRDNPNIEKTIKSFIELTDLLID